MKIRNGFVSNSSSSSFIIGAGFVPSHRLKELEELDQIRASSWGKPFRLLDLENATSDSSWYHDYHKASDMFIVESFDGSTVSVSGVTKLFDKDPGGRIIVLSSTGDEPEFDEDSWEYNYDDVGFDWFSPADQSVAGFIGSLENGEYTYGAGYNG